MYSRKSRKSQLTGFIIVGIVIVLSAIILFFALRYRGEITIKEELKKTAIIPLEREAFASMIKSCVDEVAPAFIRYMAGHGGTFQQLTNVDSRLYDYQRYRYFCKNSQGNGCVNNIITRSDMEKELNEKLRPYVKNCIDLNQFISQGYQVVEGNINVNTTIAVDDIAIRIKYPILIIKGEVKLNMADFFTSLEIPLGRLYDLAVLIVNEELTEGIFDKDRWMIDHGAEIKIQKHRPYPDTVYSLAKKARDKEFTFNFGLQGDNIAMKIGQTASPKLLPYCQIDGDKNCYANSQETLCILKGGKPAKGGKPTAQPLCSGLTTFAENRSCEDGECDDCPAMEKKHGDSWCVYDSVVGKGLDRVGSRHYGYSCVDGKLYVEECRDYREELCTQPGGQPGGKAICRVNRWQDCNKQESKEACLDQNKRDCYWSDWLDFSSAGYSPIAGTSTTKCHPYVPPGFRHWEAKEQDACSMANQAFRFNQPVFMGIQGISYPNSWSDSAAFYCYTMGDCGNYRNFLGEKSDGNYHNSDFQFPPKFRKEDQSVYLEAYYDPRLYSVELKSNVSNNEGNASNNANNLLDEKIIPRVSRQSASSVERSFNSLASSWKPCKKCGDDAFRCKKVKVLGKCMGAYPESPLYASFLRYLEGSAICSPWQAPLNGSCSLCSAEPLKPCTEYRCRSIGMNCEHATDQTSGIGICLDKGLEKRIPLTVSMVETSLPAEPANYSSEEVVYEWSGNFYDGYKIMPQIDSETFFSFELQTNRDASCRPISYPEQRFNEYLGIDISSSCRDAKSCAEVTDRGTIHSVKIRLEAKDLLVERIENAANITNLLAIVNNPFYGYGEPVSWSDLTSLIENGTSATGLLKGSLNKSLTTDLIGLKVGTNRIFFRCIDSSRQEDETNLFLELKVKNTDATAPVVGLVSPLHGAVLTGAAGLTEKREFSFIANDDAEELNCYLTIKNATDDKEYFISDLIAANVNATATYFFEEEFALGSYKWKVKCSDGVNAGWSEERAFGVS